jgi:exonuclease SbcC
MKIAIYADLHPQGARLAEWARQWETSLCIAREKCEQVLIAGDLFDQPNIADRDETAGAIIRAINGPIAAHYSDAPGKITAIPGNHDKANDSCVDACAAIEELVNVVRIPEWITLRGEEGEVLHVACVPWFWLRNAEDEITKLMASKPKTGKTMLLAHVQVIGARQTESQICEHGTFAVSRQFLESLPVDYIRLGDFHARQELVAGKGGYVGALWQCNMGEAGNPQGFEILDTETGAVEWIEVSEARRHQVEEFDSPDGLMEFTRGIDVEPIERLWIRTDGFMMAPEEKRRLQMLGVRVSHKNLPRPERAARTITIPAGALQDDAATLRLYCDSRAGEVSTDELVLITDEMFDVIAANPSMRRESARAGCVNPRRIKAINLGGTHKETVLDLTGAGNLLGVYGDNGAGKTTFFGIPFWIFYGTMPGYDATPAEMVSRDGDGTGYGEMEFEYRGATYTAKREVLGANTKTPRQEAALIDSTGKIIAGPKVTEFNAAIAAMFGDEKIALATWMMTARREGDLCEATEGDRRAIYSKLLGFERLDAVSKAAGESALKIEGEAKGLAHDLADAPDYEAQGEDLGRDRGVKFIERAGVDVDIVEAERATEAAKTALRDAVAGDEDALKSQITAHEDAKARVARTEREADSLRGAIAGLEKDEAGLAQAAADCETLAAHKVELETLEADEARYQARARWEATRDQLAAKRSGASETLAALESVPGADPETNARAWTLEAVRAEYAKAKAENDQIETARRANESEIAKADADLRSMKGEAEKLKVRMDKTPTVPGKPEVCKTCPLMKEFAGLGDLAEALAADIGKQMDRLKELRAVGFDKLHDLAEIMTRGNEAKAARDLIDNSRKAVKDAEAKRAEIATIDKQIADHATTEPKAVDNPAARLRVVRSELQRLADAPMRKQRAEQAREQLTVKRGELDEILSRLAQAVAALPSLATKADAARKTLADRESSRAHLEADVREKSAALHELRGRAQSLDREIAQLDERIKSLESRRAEHAEKTGRLRELETKARRLRFIQLAFGPKGVQPLIIDQTVPELEDIANRMLEDATDGTMSLRIATQRKNKDESIREAFEIVIATGADERDVMRFSGGERLKVQIVFRAAQAMWLAARHGVILETLMIDEVFNNLDPSNERIMADTLKAIAPHFSRIICITPNPRVADLFPQRIRVVSEFGIARIEMSGLAA